VRDLAARAPAAGVNAHAEVVGRVDTLEAAVVTSRPATGDPSFSNRIAAINGEVKALAETIGTLGRRNDEAAAAARAAQTRSDATAAAVATLAQKLPAGVAVERSQVEALAARVAAVETSEKTAARGDQAVRLVLVATALKSAVERGDPFAGELAAAKVLGADPKLTAALEPFAASGVPTSAALARELAALAPSLRPAASAPAREGFLERLQVNAEKLVRVRPTDGSPAAMPPRSRRVSRLRRRRRISPARRPSSPRSRPRHAPRPRPGSSRRRRAPPRSTPAVASPPTPSRGWASDDIRRRSRFALAAVSVCSLPPCGGGLGRGVVVVARDVSANCYPHPQPLPSRLRACPLPANIKLTNPGEPGLVGGGERTEIAALSRNQIVHRRVAVRCGRPLAASKP
jgi:hypothetical protein